jgi:hypothetical protein
MLAYLIAWPGHAPGGPRGKRRASGEETRALVQLEERRAVVRVDCPDPCPYSHAWPTPLGKLALACDAAARRTEER